MLHNSFQRSCNTQQNDQNEKKLTLLNIYKPDLHGNQGYMEFSFEQWPQDPQ